MNGLSCQIISPCIKTKKYDKKEGILYMLGRNNVTDTHYKIPFLRYFCCFSAHLVVMTNCPIMPQYPALAVSAEGHVVQVDLPGGQPHPPHPWKDEAMQSAQFLTY